MIALITPTGVRAKQIKLCSEFMKRQTYLGDVVWVIVDDGDPSTADFIPREFKRNWQVVKIYPKDKWVPGMNTQSSNLLIGLDAVNKYKPEAIFIIEDDDYYAPDYLKTMTKLLKGNDLIGEQNTVYYNVIQHRWYPNRNTMHASLFQVGFVFELIPMFRKVCLERKGKFIDICFFREATRQNKKIYFTKARLSIGIKGLPGRSGIGFGHRMNTSKMTDDTNMKKLKELIGEDYIYYV